MIEKGYKSYIMVTLFFENVTDCSTVIVRLLEERLQKLHYFTETLLVNRKKGIPEKFLRMSDNVTFCKKPIVSS